MSAYILSFSPPGFTVEVFTFGTWRRHSEHVQRASAIEAHRKLAATHGAYAVRIIEPTAEPKALQ